jgi:hydroxyacylglutathione hydrolase
MELIPNLHAFLWMDPRANNCNTYFIRSQTKNILIDPGHAPYFEHVRQGLSRLGVSEKDIDLIICTHAHPDHMEAVRLFDPEKTLFTLHPDEWQLIKAMAPYLKTAMNADIERLTPDFFLSEGDLTVGDIHLEVYHTPGHSPGGISLYWPETKALFTGDLIFKDGLGRTDLPGGSSDLLKESILRMATLDAHWLLSGHGDIISGADRVGQNFAQVEEMWFSYI